MAAFLVNRLTPSIEVKTHFLLSQTLHQLNGLSKIDMVLHHGGSMEKLQLWLRAYFNLGALGGFRVSGI
jgi:hypothetical protein